MSKIPLKVLVSPIKEPFWKYRAFGLQEYHFFEADRVQCVCDYRNKEGKLEYPWVYEIDSEKALKCRKWNRLRLIPIGDFERIELRKE